MNIPVKLRTLAWFYLRQLTPGTRETDLPEGARMYLCPSNPVLVDLQSRFARTKGLPHSCWAPWERAIPLPYFRGESVYLSQGYLRHSLERYRITTAYVEAIDENGWLRSLGDDNGFGIKVWKLEDGIEVTRDLLDSVVELLWLKRVLKWTTSERVSILDIGAGYGRFAHRFVNAFPNGTITCVDAVATSTFLSDFYLRFRKCQRTTIVPLDKLQHLTTGSFDLAINIHSWSEMPLVWVRSWLDLLVDLNVRYLFLVPNFPDFRTKEPNGSLSDFGNELLRHGYKCEAKERKFARASICDAFGVFPSDYYLFHRT